MGKLTKADVLLENLRKLALENETLKNDLKEKDLEIKRLKNTLNRTLGLYEGMASTLKSIFK